MTEEKTPSAEYPYLLDTTRLPITHNHLIGPIQGVSLDNIRGTLAFVRRLVRQADGHELYLSGDEVHGLECLLENAVQALRFEQYYRADRE
jgi:hypothetical protein